VSVSKTAASSFGGEEESPNGKLVRPPTRPRPAQPFPEQQVRTLPGISLAERRKRERRNTAIVLLMLAVICLIGEAVLLLPRSAPSPWLDVSLHSVLAADYNADLQALEQPVVGLGLLGDMYVEEGGFGVEDRMATLEARLLTPVPTVTPLPGTVHPTATLLVAAATATPASTQAPAVTSTNGATPTATHTATQTTSPTATRPGWTPTRTPTATPRATEIEPPDPTATRTLPPTQPPPTATHTPTPTRPPTETPDPYPYP
jgi:hypothetical protein